MHGIAQLKPATVADEWLRRAREASTIEQQDYILATQPVFFRPLTYPELKFYAVLRAEAAAELLASIEGGQPYAH